MSVERKSGISSVDGAEYTRETAFVCRVQANPKPEVPFKGIGYTRETAFVYCVQANPKPEVPLKDRVHQRNSFRLPGTD